MDSIEVSSENLGSLKRKFTVTVPQKNVQDAYKKSYNSIKGKVNIPGFRKGKVPQSLIEKRFGEQMKHETLERLVPQYFDLAIRQEKVEPVVRPQFDNLDIDKTQPFVFSATFEIKPEFDIPAYNTFKIEAEEVEVSDEEVEKQKSVHLERAATYVEKDGAVEDGDQVIIDFKPIEENPNIPPSENHSYILGSKQLLPEFEEVLPGMKVGEEKNFSISYPEEYFNKELRGVSAEMTIKLNKLEGRVLPELNDDFFSRYGETVKTEEDFMTLVKNEIKSMKENEIKVKRQGELRKQLAEKLEFEVPEQILEEEINIRVQEQQRKAKETEGAEEKSEDDLKNEVKADALSQLRFSFFVEKMIQDEEIKVDQSEVNRRFQMNCSMLGIDPQMFIQQDYGRHFYQQTQGIVAEETVLNYLTDKVLEK